MLLHEKVTAISGVFVKLQYYRDSDMQIYTDIDNDSNVVGYEINNTSIIIWFNGTPNPYTYSYASAGQHHVDNMKRLAVSGNGLNAYINNNVKFKCER